MERDQKKPILNLDIEGDEKKVNEPTGEDLKYNAETDSFELDPETGEGDYQHPSPYDTSAPAGEDDNSSYDEQNPYTQSEYQDKNNKIEDQLERSETDRVVESFELEDRDEKLTISEDTARDPSEDEEGYPKKDDAGGEDNPIM